ncbi:hypothetical protein, partial [Klebsiella michiganensis]|uniref:hypothetical protein n=1 Tax=Klebsiella michiganensis TaxID=1134687 RepID=UPI003F89431A
MASSRLALRLAGLRADWGYGFPGVCDPVARTGAQRRLRDGVGVMHRRGFFPARAALSRATS